MEPNPPSIEPRNLDEDPGVLRAPRTALKALLGHGWIVDELEALWEAPVADERPAVTFLPNWDKAAPS